MFRTSTTLAATFALATMSACAQTPPPAGELSGTAWVHSKESLNATVSQADVCLPPAATGGATFFGKLRDAPKHLGSKVPVILFLHGSSGLGLKAIGQWQQWLCTLGYASIAPDSFALPGHVTYKSPIDKDSYEKILALRASEIAPALETLKGQAWADVDRLILAGASEGAVPVARYAGHEFKARIVYSWSCESNYFVKEPLNSFDDDKPVLNVISAEDPFFSKANPWLGNSAAVGHCGAALKGNPQASVLLVPNAPQIGRAHV